MLNGLNFVSVKCLKSDIHYSKEPKVPEQNMYSQSPIISFNSHRLSPIWIQYNFK